VQALALPYAVGIIFNCALNMLLLVIPIYLSRMGVPPLQVGIAVAAPAVLIATTRLVVGPLIDRVGARTVILMALGMMAASTALLATTTTFAPLMIAQVLSGFSRAVFWPAIQTHISRIPAYSIQQRMGWLSTSTSLGGIAGPLLGGIVIGTLGFAAAFSLLAIFSVLGGSLTLLLPGAEGALGKKPAGRAAQAVRQPGAPLSLLFTEALHYIKQRQVYIAGFITVAAALPLALASSFLPIYLEDVGFASSAVGALSSVRTMTMVLMGLSFGLLSARLGTRRILLMGVLTLAASLLATPLLTGVVPLAFAVALLGVAQSSFFLSAVTLVSLWSPPEKRGLAMGINGTFWGLSILLMPLLLGGLVELWSIRVALQLTAVATLFLGVGSLRYIRAPEPQEQSSLKH